MRKVLAVYGTQMRGTLQRSFRNPTPISSSLPSISGPCGRQMIDQSCFKSTTSLHRQFGALTQHSLKRSYPLTRLVGSAAYTERVIQVESEMAAPESMQPQIGEVSWDAQIANSSSLVGRLGRDAEAKQTRVGPVTSFSIAVPISRDKQAPPLWMEVEAWGELGNAAVELRKGEQIHVMGRLIKGYNPQPEEGKTGALKLRATSVDRIVGGRSTSYTSSYVETGTSQMPYFDSTEDSQVLREGGSNNRDAKWEFYLAHQDLFYDNTLTKTNPKAPDFVHKTTREGLWLSSAPDRIKQQLQAEGLSLAGGLSSSPPQGDTIAQEMEAIEGNQTQYQSPPRQFSRDPAQDAQKWEHLLANFDQYWDNSENKRNPKSPDYKHKKTQEALWLNSAPSWAKEKLGKAGHI